MSEQMLVQCKLLRGTTTLVSWLDSRKKFRVGNYVTLKGLDGRWEIKTIGRTDRSEQHPPRLEQRHLGVDMLLVIGILLLLVFAGLGFAMKVLWWGLVIGLVLIVADFVRGKRRGRT